MAKGEIKQTIRLQGEKEYSAALKSANTQLRTLKTQLKAETAELGKNASAQDKAAVKTANLQKQIAAQEKVVATLTKALAEAKKDYGDNEEVVARWEQKLNNARATLANMKNDMEGLGEGVQDATKDINMGTVATKSFADSLASISSVAGSVSDTIENIFHGVVDIVSDTIRELWDLISDTAARANHWTDLANYYGSSAQDVQKWDQSISAAAGSFEDFIQLVNTFAYGGKEDKIESIFGISRDNYSDTISYTIGVLQTMKEARAEMNREEWNTAMEEIFGMKRSQKAEWFFTNWDTWFNNAKDYNANEGGFGLGDQELETMNEVWVKINEIETKWAALKDTFAAGFGEISGELMIKVSGGLDALNAFLKADNEADREKALEDLRKNVEGFFAELVKAIRTGLDTLKQVGEEMSKSDDSLTAGIGNALIALTDTFEWLVNNQDAVVTAVKAIMGVWVSAKVLKAVGIIAQMAANIAVIKGFSLAGGAAAGAGAGGAGAAAGGGGGGGWFSGLLAGAGTKLSKLSGAVSTFVSSAPLFLEAGEQIEKWGVGDTLKKWFTLGGHATDQEVEEMQAAGAKVMPELNMARLLFDPLNTLAEYAEKSYIAEHGDETGSLAESAEDAAEELDAVADAARKEHLEALQRQADRENAWLMEEYGLTQPITTDQKFALAEMFGYDMFDELSTLEDFYRMYSELGDAYTWDESVGQFVPTLDSATAAISAMTMAANELPGNVSDAVSRSIKATPITVYVHTTDLLAGAGSMIGSQVQFLMP